MAASADSEFPSKRSAAAGATALGGNRGARRSLANDLYNERHHQQYQQQQQQLQLPLEAYSPRLFTKKHLLLLQQQQRQYQFVEDQHHRQPPPNLLNSRRVYPSSSSSRNHQFLRNGAGDLSSTDCSNHGSPLMPRKVPKKMVVDEKQLAMKILRARNALACSSSSTSSSSSSSENASLRASIESGELPHRLSAAELARRSLLSGCVSKSLMNTAMHQKLIASSGISRNRSGNESAGNVHEKKVSCVAAAAGSSGRNSDAEDCVRLVTNRDFRQQLQQQQQRAVGPVLLRSASCSSANSSALTKLVRLKAADMALGMQEHAFYCANEVLDGMDKLHCKRVAWVLKKEFDKAYGPAWHCVVGTSFGSYVTHSVGGFLYFSIGKISVLLFQTAVELIEHH